MSSVLRLAVALASLCCLLPLLVIAAESPAAAPPARLGLCAACHGRDGIAVVPDAPNLAGQRLDYLRSALAQYRDGRRDVAVMRAAIGPLSDAELDRLARWYAAQPAAGSTHDAGDAH